MSELIERHRRYLPHYQEAGQIISLTWRLEGDLPQAIEALIKELKDLMAKIRSRSNDQYSLDLYMQYDQTILRYDEQLGRYKSPSVDLRNTKLATVISKAFHFYDKNLYNLHAYCIMPNHIHLLVEPLMQANGKYAPVSDIVRRLKGYTARQIIASTPDVHKIWRDDYFDRFIRNEKDYEYTVNYILNNPVKAELCDTQGNWPFSFFIGWCARK